MDPTTLVTFLFKAPPEVRTVELLGSWDNFTRPYYMHHDKRRGHGFWAGCFHFRDIIFDGDRADWTRPRSGGLKQGGTYWYFYRLNDAVEAFDDARDFTRECPLLPGQTVNVIDVPVEVEEPPSRRRSATVDVIGELAELQRTHTLDPEDKWAALEPPPVSKVHERCISDLALNGRLESKPHSYRDAHISPPVSPVSGNLQTRLAVPRPRSAAGARTLASTAGWSSAPPSRSDSSIFDAFVDRGRGTDDASLSALPLPDAYHANARPITRDGGNAYRGFDFAFDSTSTRHSNSRTGDDDLDGSSFIFEPADSPPHSAYGSIDWRFTVPPAEHTRDDSPHDDAPPPPPTRSPPPAPRRSTDSTTSHPDMEPSPDAFDLGSPTFSAATISSHGGGLNTPFRLSFPQPPSHSHSHSTGQADTATTSIEDITARLRQFGSEDSAATLSSRADTNATDDSGEGEAESHDERKRRREFVSHYALPVHPAMDSTTTLGKVSSGRASLATMRQGQQQRDPWKFTDVPPLPTTATMGPTATGNTGFLGQLREPSFADAIFDELGYLGASIA